MLLDVYRSRSNPNKFLSVPSGTDVQQLRVSELDKDYEEVAPFSKNMEVDPAVPRAGFNSKAILQDVAEHGFATHAVSISVSISHARRV